MSDQTETLPCRSVGPTGLPCKRKRGHTNAKHSDGLGGYWMHGINKPAVAVAKSVPDQFAGKREEDDGHMSEGDYQSWGRIFNL